MVKSLNWWMRKLHRWGAFLIAVPLLIVILSGLLLQVKKQVSWVQPPTISGSSKQPELAWNRILEKSREVTEAEVENWQDIDRIDVRIGKGVLKVRCKSGWEIQLDAVDGKLLSSNYRRSDLIENIHDGSIFSDAAKLWVFLPNGLVLLALWFTGIYLWYLPLSTKRKKKRREKGKRMEPEQDTLV